MRFYILKNQKYINMEIPEAIKKQIDDLFVGIEGRELHDRDLPGWFTDSIVFHKDGKPLFMVSKNIMDGIDLRIFPSMSNVVLFGYEQSPTMQEYFEDKFREEIGLDFDISYVMGRKLERDYLDILIPLLKEFP